MVEAPAHDADRAFHILTLGCSKNRVDSDGMDHLLRSRGMTASERPEDARVVIVNTCGFLGAARDESVAAISELLDRRRDDQVVIAAGCMPALGNYRDDIPSGVDHVLTTREWHRIGDVVGGSAGRGAATGGRRLRGDADYLQPGPGRTLGLRQGCRRLRSRLRLLHHPQHQGAAGKQAAAARVAGDRRSRRAGDEGDRARRPGHHPLRGRPRHQARAAESPHADRRRCARPPLVAPALHLPQPADAAHGRRHGRARRASALSRHADPARRPDRVAEHEPPQRHHHDAPPHRPCPRQDAGRRDAHHPHRRLPRRDRPAVPDPARFCRGAGVRPRRGLHLLAGAGHEGGHARSARGAGTRRRRAPQRDHGSAAGDLAAQEPGAGGHRGCRC